MSQKIDVIGLGPSHKTFKPSENITIGVNDICRFFTPDHLIVIDHPEKNLSDYHIKAGRQKMWEVIKHSKPGKFWTNQKQWLKYHPTAQIFNSAPWFMTLKMMKLKDQKIDQLPFLPTGANSPLTAAALAYYLGATEIILYGCDYTPDWIKDQSRKINQDFKPFILKEWKWIASKMDNCRIFIVNTNSILSEIFQVKQ